MSRLEETTAWLYQGIWGVLTKWFRVPSAPPSLPVQPGEQLQSLRPSQGFLRYLKFKFWLALVFIDVALLIGWLSITLARPAIGLWIAPVAILIIVLPDIIAYVAIHLRYDTTWYVLTQRSIRIRRGIWLIQETTITFENIQNVSMDSGPLERWFGIANVIVDTAGGGPAKDHDGKSMANPHRGVIEGVDSAPEIRNLILKRIRRSRSSGVGDEPAQGQGWGSQHIAVLREIRDALSKG
jgi:membrane protein YdbS with pleckstrin-like domain